MAYLVTNILEDNETTRNHAYRETIAEQVKVCKVTKTWSPETSKMTIFALPGSAAHPVANSIMTVMTLLCKGVRKHSVAPKGVLERKLQKCIDNAESSDSDVD